MAKKKINKEDYPIITSQELFQKGIGEVVKDAYLDFGSYINLHRHLAEVKDGMKISYRRLIYASTKFPKGKLIPSAEFIPTVSAFHPHSLTGIEGLNATLVNSGIFTGEGSFGYVGIDGIDNPHANPRYTKNRLSDLYWEIIGDSIKEVPYTESPVGALEPAYIPLALPLCLRWDTKIVLTDGRSLTLREITEEFNEGKELFTLSCSLDGDFQVTKIINSCKTKTTNKYLKITLDNNQEIYTTEDHLFMLRDGSYLEAGKLTVGESLMPGYISYSDDGRRLIKNNYSLNNVLIYRLSDLYNVNHGVYSVDLERLIVHHKDKNKLNDDPTNLIRINKLEHGQYHREDFINNVRTEEAIRKRKEGVRLYWEYEENHIKARKRWAATGDIPIPNKDGKTRREISRENRINYNKSEKAVDNIKNWWKSDDSLEHREKQKKMLQERNKSDEMRNKLKDWWESDKGEERKEKLRAQVDRLNSDPDNVRKSTRNRYISDFKKYIKAGISRSKALELTINRPGFSKWFSSKEDFLEAEKTYNHTIISIEVIESETTEDFYDITVDSKYHNFLLDAGVVVHNCLYLSNLVEGLGVGIRTKYPNFSPKSMYQAYINNNPYLLEPNVNLLLDKERSELERLWKTGKGSVIYAYKISRQMSPDGKAEGILFEGDTGIFTPNLTKLRALETAGKIFIDDMTDLNGPKLFVGRIPGARGITIEEIETLCRKACYNNTVYQLNVTDGNTAFRIPLYDWIDYTYKNYIKLVTEINQKRIEKVKFDIMVQEALPVISNYIINTNPKATDKEICDALGVSPEIVSSVMSKPISYLRKNKDTSERVKELKNKLKELKKFDPVVYTENIINLM